MRHRFATLGQCDLWSSPIFNYVPFVGKILLMQQETSNTKDHFAVAIVKAETIVDHIPHNFSLCFQLFSDAIE